VKDRLPTKLNLQRRDLLELAANTCVSGCGSKLNFAFVSSLRRFWFFMTAY